jgi:hypothetical protein
VRSLAKEEVLFGSLGRSEGRVEVKEISGWVRRKDIAQRGTRRCRRRVTVERVAVSDLPGRKDPFWKEYYEGGARKRRKICEEGDGQAGDTKLGRIGEDRSTKMDGRWLREGFW